MRLPEDLEEERTEIADELSKCKGIPSWDIDRISTILACDKNSCGVHIDRSGLSRKRMHKARVLTGIMARLHPSKYLDGQLQRLKKHLHLNDEVFDALSGKSHDVLSTIEETCPEVLSRGMPSSLSAAIIYIASHLNVGIRKKNGAEGLTQMAICRLVNITPTTLKTNYRRITDAMPIEAKLNL